MKIEFDIQISEKDLYDFNLYQAYTGVNGWLTIFIAILAFAAAFVYGSNGEIQYVLLYIMLGGISLLYLPVSLKTRVKATMKTNTVLSGVLHYEISNDGIVVSQNGEKGELPWNQVYKIVANNKRVLIYSGRKNAYIIPMEQLGDKYMLLSDMAGKNLPEYRIKLK